MYPEMPLYALITQQTYFRNIVRTNTALWKINLLTQRILLDATFSVMNTGVGIWKQSVAVSISETYSGPTITGETLERTSPPEYVMPFWSMY